VRVDSGIGPGSEISPMYDPMVAKLIVWDVDRDQATRRMVRALREYQIGELKTLLPFHEAILQTEQWANAQTCRDLIEDRNWLKTLAFPAPSADATAAVTGSEGGEEAGPPVEQSYTVEVSGKRFEVKVIGPPFAGGGVALNGTAASAPAAGRKAPRRSERAAGGGGGAGGDTLASPIQGTVLKVAVEAGAVVEEGALIAVIEAMKMENEITAHKGGKVAELPIAVGASVAHGDTIAVITRE
jgi:acetyl-CoA/propionyl-CoA carboxylase biotin carboxyl carrier protein